jgi:hypothetical protein
MYFEDPIFAADFPFELTPTRNPFHETIGKQAALFIFIQIYTGHLQPLLMFARDN